MALSSGMIERANSKSPLLSSRAQKPHRRSTAAAVVVAAASPSNRGFGAKPSPSSSSSSSPSSAQTKNEPPIPASREEAIAQAATALAASLSSNSSSSSSSSVDAAEALAAAARKKKGSKSNKGFARPTLPARATLEVPVADESPAATAALAVDLLNALAAESSKSITKNARLVFADVDAALAASDLLGEDSPVAVSALDDDDESESDETECEEKTSLLLIVAPTPQQAPRAASLLSSKRFRLTNAALLNAKWEASGPPEALSGFSASYAFVPLEVQGFLGAVTTTAGVMLCARVPGGPAQPLWRIYRDENGRGSFAVVGRSQKRPGPRDIEDAFYNSAAASSPVTKGVAAIRGIFNKNDK